MSKVWEQDIGNVVLCDFCNKDYTNSDEEGGLIFSSHAICPSCEPAARKNINKAGEAGYIVREAAEGESFRDMVLDYRGGDNTVRIWSP